MRDSRNSNSTPYNNQGEIFNPKSDGWRVWDIDENSGSITLISAGDPETYYHANGKSTESVDILKNRDCSMYVNNEYATSAHILTAEEALEWYNKNFDKSLTLNEESSSTFLKTTFTTVEPISVLENGAYYRLASAYDMNTLYYVNPYYRNVNYNAYNSGFRNTHFSNYRY